MSAEIRLNKRMAELGLCSRREADTLIKQGVVVVNGKPAVIGQKVLSTDTIVVNNENAADKVYLAYYKGRGIITHSPAAHETDIATRLKNDYGITDVYPIGRLDKDSEGLLLLTNDGRVTAPLLDPKASHAKEYLVSVDKPITGQFLKHMATGVNIEGYTTKPAQTAKKSEKQFCITLTEGKKHQIRRMCAALGYQVQSLKRLRIMHIELWSLKPNQYRKLTGAEVKQLLTDLDIKN